MGSRNRFGRKKEEGSFNKWRRKRGEEKKWKASRGRK